LRIHLGHLLDFLLVDFSFSDEFSPEEFGVSHPTLKAFIPLEDLGSRMIAGKPAGEKSCARGICIATLIPAAEAGGIDELNNLKYIFCFVLLLATGFDNAGFVIG
jgi:hypothetical protein